MVEQFARMRTTMTAGGLAPAVAIAAILAISACATKPNPAPATSPPPASATTPAAKPAGPPPQVLNRKQQIANALILLNQGQVSTARIGIAEMLTARPDDAVAKDLLQQIDTDPRVLLGERSFAYTIRRNETLSMIAGRFLGNSNRFWALARYNNIAVPQAAGYGRVIQIPGVAPVRVARPAPPARPAAAETPAAAVAPPAPRVDAAGADRFRRAGLAELSRGSVNKAVPLLERAQSLNPGDAAIQADLARARKIQQTLRGN